MQRHILLSGTTVLTPKGHLTGDNVDTLYQLMTRVIMAPRPHLILDLSETRYMDACTLGLIVVMQQRFERAGGKLLVSGYRLHISGLFGACLLTDVFGSLPATVEEADRGMYFSDMTPVSGQ